MPSFNETTTSTARPEEVWKILYDPYRFPEWWSGIETVVVAGTDADRTDYTMYTEGYPDFPMPQILRTDVSEHRAVVSCLVSDLRFEWTLEPIEDGAKTRISVYVDVPNAETHRLNSQREIISAALTGLANLAAHSAA